MEFPDIPCPEHNSCALQQTKYGFAFIINCNAASGIEFGISAIKTDLTIENATNPYHTIFAFRNKQNLRKPKWPEYFPLIMA
jgi:hypothetical protein